MDKGILQRYSTWAKTNLENQIEVSLNSLGINGDDDIKKAKQVGDIMTIEGDPTSYPAEMFGKRKDIIDLVTRNGYRNVIEEFAYTWFNRFVALRFMEVHGYLDHGFRVLSNISGGIEPEILKNINLVKDELRLDINLCNEYKQQGKLEELFRHVLTKQCNVLSGILPMLFSSDLGYLELLLPKTLLKGETVVTRLVEIPEAAFLEDVEIIGWMYQFYISSKKDEVYASKKTITKETLPAVTQLFTPDWIVRYMAENSVGRLWLESYPNSKLRSEMKYYVEDAEQTEEVQKKIDEIKYKNVNPEDIRIIEPCCGSGHILVYVFDLLYKIYEERGYQKRDIPTLILKNNLVGLDVDKRAAQLASFSLVMKARKVNNRFFNKEYYELPHVYELQDSKLLIELGYRKCLKDLNLLGEEEISQIDYIVKTFENGKTIGSLLKVEPVNFAWLETILDNVSKNAIQNLFNTEFLNAGIKRLRILVKQAKVLSAKYDVMITNPPYINPSTMEDVVKEYAINNYPKSKTDMFAMFMETDYIEKYGFVAMINMHGWMFLSSFDIFREKIYEKNTVMSMIHLGAHAFEAITGEVVQTTSFIMRRIGLENYNTVYHRLVEYKTQEEKKKAFLMKKNIYCCSLKKYQYILGKPIAYWISDNFAKIFMNPKISTVLSPKQGTSTGDNKRFLRLWFEVGKNNIQMNKNGDYSLRWYPATKGGEYRKWYGNNEYVVDWQNDGYRIKNFKGSAVRNPDANFLEGLTWTGISGRGLGMRYCPPGFVYLISGKGIIGDFEKMLYCLAFCSTKIANEILKVTSPSLSYEVGYIASLPIIIIDKKIEKINKIALDCIRISRADWDSFETSWDFQSHPFLRGYNEEVFAEANNKNYNNENKKAKSTIETYYLLWKEECQKRFDQLRDNEESLNHIFIDIYGLEEELTPEVDDKDITVCIADKERDMKSFISYLVGVAMGRYSLDVPGLVYAGGEWDASKYVSYQPDDDGIIPIYNDIGMEDGLTMVLINLIKQIYGDDAYRQNIDFIADALGKNNNESSEETLNRYLNDGFYADHLKIYQKRPIYWLFTSGKKNGFKSLIYMHRYNSDTLARINAKYFLPESTRMKNELDELNGKIAHPEEREKLKYEKERQNLAAAYNEVIEYGQILDHMANQYISIDLDAGVKANYEKFQGIEIVTDGGSKVKKDLLAPLK